jgi:hypothetical protein
LVITSDLYNVGTEDAYTMKRKAWVSFECQNDINPLFKEQITGKNIWGFAFELMNIRSITIFCSETGSLSG